VKPDAPPNANPTTYIILPKLVGPTPGQITAIGC
jgi:hypothetical protein